MKDTRDCPNCIFHDLTCKRWDCKEITRKEAEMAVDILSKFTKKFDEAFLEGIHHEETET